MATLREKFQGNTVKPIEVSIDKRLQTAEPKVFGTGSLGWHTTGKQMVEVDGERVQCQVNVIVTVVGSKTGG